MIPILAALLGGAAEGIYMTGKNAQDEEQKMRLRQFESDLEAKRLATVEAMREKADQAKEERKRQGNVNDAKTIESDATKRAQARDLSGIEKARGLVNVDPAEREPISPEDVKTMRGMMTPEFAKQNYGLEPETRTQSLRDKADAAQGIGRTDMAGNFEKSLDEERRFAADQDRATREQKRLDQSAIAEARKEREGIARDEVNNKRADASLRIAAAAETRAAAAQARIDKGGNLTEGERKTYTTLLSDTSRNIKSARDSLKNIYDDTEKKAVKDQIAVLEKDHDTYASLLAGTQSGKGTSEGKDKPAAKEPAKAETLPMPSSKKDLVSNKVYQTSRGPARWNGSAFESVN